MIGSGVVSSMLYVCSNCRDSFSSTGTGITSNNVTSVGVNKGVEEATTELDSKDLRFVLFIVGS